MNGASVSGLTEVASNVTPSPPDSIVQSLETIEAMWLSLCSSTERRFLQQPESSKLRRPRSTTPARFAGSSGGQSGGLNPLHQEPSVNQTFALSGAGHTGATFFGTAVVSWRICDSDGSQLANPHRSDGSGKGCRMPVSH